VPDYNIEIGRRLEAGIADASLLKKEFAHQMGVDPSTVSLWISGKQPMNAGEIRRAAEIVGKPTYWLMGEEPSGEGSVFAHDLHRLDPAKREIAINVIRTLREQQRREAKEEE
jgi:transcriptional regulator with XRE-family HTH domain